MEGPDSLSNAMISHFQIVDSGWDQVLSDAVNLNSDELRIVCPFIKVRTVERLLSGKDYKAIQAITRFHPGEMCAGVNDPEALRLLLEMGAQIRGVKGLHAKLYLFGNDRAVATSANLTESALLRNHEFGFVTSAPVVIQQCHKYFDSLWGRAGEDLDSDRLAGWEKRITEARVAGAPSFLFPGFVDEGTDALLIASSGNAAPANVDGRRAFVKFFGEGNSRVSHDFPVLDEVKSSGSHWACAYPKTKRPRQVNDGDVMFISRMVEDPHDIIVYGRAIGMRHVEERDEATPEEIADRSWKESWPMYVRVHHGEFVAGTLRNGVRLSELMDTLRSDAFVSTQTHARTGSGNTDPRNAYRRQAQVQLTMEAHAWLNERLEEAFATHGRLERAELEALDWPKLGVSGALAKSQKVG